MKQPVTARIGLRGLILLFVVASVLATLASSLRVAYQVQRQALIDLSLDTHRAYAARVASSLDAFLVSAQSRLAYSAQALGTQWDQPQRLDEEVRRLQADDIDFNTVAVIDANGIILKASPDKTQLQGRPMPPARGIETVLGERQPTVSPAYVSPAGNLMVFIAHPVVSPSGELLGAVGGSIYLARHGTLQTLISRHFQHEQTVTLVTDSHHRVLYHPKAPQVGRVMEPAGDVDAALGGAAGSMAVQTPGGPPLLAGYAPVPRAGWAVVTRQPQARALAPLWPMTRAMLLGVIPPALLGLVLILLVANLIARPLRELSAAADDLGAADASARLLRINAWYQDALAIRRAMLASVAMLQQKLGRLDQQAHSDALTGLANRRALARQLDLLEVQGTPYAVLALDIDHFKRVNDTFGHDHGDVALQHVATLLRENARASDLPCRSGGEEFLLVMPDTADTAARQTAERIRAAVETHDIPVVGRVTVSIGVHERGEDDAGASAVLKRADEALYRAKQRGRNRVV